MRCRRKRCTPGTVSGSRLLARQQRQKRQYNLTRPSPLACVGASSMGRNLSGKAREQPGIRKRRRQTFSFLDAFLEMVKGMNHGGVAQRLLDDRQRREQRDAVRQQHAKSIAHARTFDLGHQRSHQRDTQEPPVPLPPAGGIAADLLGRKQGKRHQNERNPLEALRGVANGENDLGDQRQFVAGLIEHVREAWNDHHSAGPVIRLVPGSLRR
jgi:hypothetical protein